MANELIEVRSGVAELNNLTSKRIADIERAIKDLKERKDAFIEQILAEMQEKNILKIETEEIIINRIDASNRETFDSKKLREDNPDLYDEYVKITPVKASVRIKVK